MRTQEQPCAWSPASPFSPEGDTPRYIQVADALRHRILDGEFAANDPLPSESETVRAFDISRVR
ncbi:MAG: GntR family transcriptional regulator [Mesorhizobium sp.]|uniref:GntR family transcriptional regulator n=1 Tax=Mesorhizobium sp. TaxID=1871066 RepID=UPI00122857F9|nr:MAG: GntR family transcriptional regulator [Mesorhizobium sp.]TIO36364.1 MAG: GntR family transcriptional regulator [Mesorhizobium sp.]TIP11263.1 MAG: GntR family transcriptional regulator [Mesorhizobium sp.]